VGVHGASGRCRVGRHIGVSIQLGKKFLDVAHPQYKGQGLVSIVAGAKIAWLVTFRQGNLGHFLAVAKDAELGFAAEDFTTADQAGLPAFVCQAVIFQYILALKISLIGLNFFCSINHFFLSIPLEKSGSLIRKSAKCEKARLLEISL
jgi:hypothetical protein